VIKEFNQGMSSFLEGVRLLKKDRSLRILGIVPALMSLVLYTAGLVISSMYIDEIMSWSIKVNVNDYNVYLKSLIYILSFLLLGFILYFVTFFVVSILAIPVCATLSQRVMVLSGHFSPTQKSFKNNIFTFANMARVSVLKLGFLFIISGMLFVASFLPLTAPVAVYLSLMLLTFDCMDYAMEQDELSLRQRFRFLLRYWVEFSGFSLCMAVILAIPFIHFILLPSAVLGTTVLYTRIQMSQKK
jgi:CysZ protein